MRPPLYLAALLLFAHQTTAQELTNKVLIIGVDGAMNSAMAVAHTPNLDLLKSNGCYSVRAVTHPVTHSAACWSSMFTGVWGDKHLVNDPGNSFAGNDFSNYPSFFRHLEDANNNWNTLCFARWAPLITVVPDADETRAFGSDAEVTAETCRRLTNSNPDVFFMILLDVDSAGHSYGWGPTVTNYVRAIETADGRIGQILNALRGRATYTNENWLVIAMTDHGQHDDPDPERSRITWHIVSGPSAARGVMWPLPSIVDICATVLTHMGVPIDPAWNLDARVEGLPLRPVSYGVNLIFNGDAEANSGSGNYSTNRGAAWWFDISSTSLGAYGANAQFPSLASPGPPDRGANFFLGGSASGSILQRIDISELAGDVDDLGVGYRLSGWFGGGGTDEDYASLNAAFISGSGAVLGSNFIGKVTAADRGGVTGLLERGAGGELPAGTRFVEFTLTNHVTTGQNDASADNLSFVLTPRYDLPWTIHVPVATPDGWRIDFVGRSGAAYNLERSEDLRSWMEISPPVPGVSGRMSMMDTNAPAAQAFYRVKLVR